ncbi:MAG: FtsX-like permease family protein [Candidatus Hydrothermales bacterium]
MDIIKMAFRNLFRNKRRSFLTSLSLLVAGFVVVVLHGYVTGFLKGMKENIINWMSGHIIIAKEEYFSRKFFVPQEEYLENPYLIKEKLKEFKYVSFYTERLKSMGIIFKKDINKPVLIFGIDSEKERRILEIDRKIVSGTYDLKEGVLLGKELSKSLDLNIGDTVVIISKTVLGGLNGIKMKVNGIVNVGFSEFDKKVVIISISNMRRLLKMPEGVHEILVFLKDENKIKDFKKNFKLNGITARDYVQELGSFSYYFKLANNIYYFIYILIIILATFTVINTMTVAVFERLREIGTLKALGMRDLEIFLLFGIEGTILGTFGGIIGAFFGWFVNIFLNFKGINMESAVRGMSIAVPYVIRPTANFYVVIFAIFLITVICSIVSMIPAFYAKRLTPQETLREI